jgi:hypothetical protein
VSLIHTNFDKILANQENEKPPRLINLKYFWLTLVSNQILRIMDGFGVVKTISIDTSGIGSNRHKQNVLFKPLFTRSRIQFLSKSHLWQHQSLDHHCCYHLNLTLQRDEKQRDEKKIKIKGWKKQTNSESTIIETVRYLAKLPSP